MIALFGGVGHAFERRRRMIELPRNLNPQFRVPRHRVVINRDAAVGGDEFALFGQDQRIDFQ